MVVELCSPEDKLAKVYDIVGDSSNIVTKLIGLRDDVDYHIKVYILVNGRSISLVEHKSEKNGEYISHLKLSDQTSAIMDSTDETDLLNEDQLDHLKSE